MADVIRKATNRFTKGLVMDFSPENTKNEVLTHALNATLLTFNGNELSLQNDMGNARVETAYLPEGYMPVGTCEYGGIIYIVSYNPLENKSQIGCFPSPERNLSNDELGVSDAKITKALFQGFEEDQTTPDGTIKNTSQCVLLRNDNLNPGDKFIVTSTKDIYNEHLSGLLVKEDQESEFKEISNPIIALNIVSIEDSGKIVYLNSDLLKYDVVNSHKEGDTTYTNTYRYHILGSETDSGGVFNPSSVDVDSYRNVLSSGYSVFKSKTSGKLAILAELITIDSYSVTHELRPKTVDGKVVEGSFDLIIHSEITPEVTTSNYLSVPKLKYYYLDNSQGYVQISDGVQTLFATDDNGKALPRWNSDFFSVKLSNMYVPTSGDNLDLSKTLDETGSYNFPRPNTYHGRMESYTGSIDDVEDSSVYTKLEEGKFHRISKSQIWGNDGELYSQFYLGNLRAKFYKYSDAQDQYQKVNNKSDINESYVYYVKDITPEYIDAARDEQYKNNPAYTLYKLDSQPVVATDKEINDSSIEKYAYEPHNRYEKTNNAVQDYLDGKEVFLWDESKNEYVGLVSSPTDLTLDYYVFVNIDVLVPIGKVLTDLPQKIIYYFPLKRDYIEPTPEELEGYWNFEDNPVTDDPTHGYDLILYWKDDKTVYIEATESEILQFEELGIELYYKTDYILVDNMLGFSDSISQLFIVVPADSYIDSTNFKPNASSNYIEGYPKPTGVNEPEGGFPKDDPISLHTVADFIPKQITSDVETPIAYSETKLGSIKIPGVLLVNDLDLKFKYDYTIVPCMNYGKLQHLAVSNTVDFSKLNAFNQSTFSTWKYIIEGNQLRLTFGADVYDTYEMYKVDGLFLEFYDSWGFAGSIEITNKKSYSGIFTKVINLNSLLEIGNKPITGVNYGHNINIVEKRDAEGKIVKDQFTLNGRDVVWNNESGWNITDSKLNDCGTLYSNTLYGVKAYLRRDIGGAKEFIKTNEFFLYTLPLYNKYYYTIPNFNNLSNPTLDFVLTYKLEDSGTKLPYTATGFTDGYCNTDKTLVDSYKGGFLQVDNFNITKYYNYTGESKLYLEIGLQKDYENFNIRYDPDINTYFYGTIELLSNTDNSNYDVVSSNSTNSTLENKLYYNNTDGTSIDANNNKLGFGDSYAKSKTITPPQLPSYNFLYTRGSYIPIKYNFIVGYPVSISNIHSSEIPATTICALCHSNSFGEYNYEDFGVYEHDGQFLSSAMFYNGGDANNELFGVCRLINTSGENMTTQCQSIASVSSAAQDLTTQTKLNSGDPLKQMSTYIGKLTFCQPHAHCLDENSGVNVYKYNSSMGVAPYTDFTIKDATNDSKGIVPRRDLFDYPLYNMSLNTKNSITYYSEFISTLDYKTTSGKVWGFDDDKSANEGDDPVQSEEVYTMREYTGFTASNIASFNKAMIETMKNVYAYNPDYNSLSIRVGDVNVTSDKISFNSNIICRDAHLYLGNRSLNDFIYFGTLSVSKYLEYLNQFSNLKGYKSIKIANTDGSTLTQLEFLPDLTYCGGNSNYLISSLTYNVPTPIELEDSLSYNSNSSVVVQHHDGTRSFLNGVPNKKLLYGFTEGKLIQLDVSNYKINSSGALTVSLAAAQSVGDAAITLPASDVGKYVTQASSQYYINKTITDAGESKTLKLQVRIYPYGNFSVPIGTSTNSENSFFMVDSGYFSASVNVVNTGSSATAYKSRVKSIKVEVKGRVLNKERVNIPMLLLQNRDTLHDLIHGNSDKGVTLYRQNNYPVTQTNSYWWASLNDGDHYVTCTSGQWSSNTFQGSQPIFKMNGSSSGISLFEFKVSDIDIEISKETSLVNGVEGSDIIHVNKTPANRYASISTEVSTRNKYVITSTYNTSRLRGTSITLNDLVYEPNTSGHRLFIRNGCYSYTGSYRNIIYYRGLSSEHRATWKADDTYQHKNHLYLQTGPCFTSDNL